MLTVKYSVGQGKRKKCIWNVQHKTQRESDTFCIYITSIFGGGGEFHI